MTAEVRRLFVLHCGHEVIPLAVSLRGADPALWIAVPITAYLLDTARGWVMVDAGLDEGHLRDPARLDALFLSKGWDPPPLVRPEHEQGRQLAALGVGWGEVGRVVLSHLHAGHTGHLKRMPPAVWTVERVERDHAFSAAAGDAWFRSDHDAPAARLEVVEGGGPPQSMGRSKPTLTRSMTTIVSKRRTLRLENRNRSTKAS